MELFVANFDENTDEEDLNALFSEYGRVRSVTIIAVSSSGGYGFVDMPNESDAMDAIEGLNGLWRNRRKLKVNKKREKFKYEE